MRIWALPDAIILTEMRLQNATNSIGMTRDPMFLHQTFVTQAIDIMKWIRTCFYFSLSTHILVPRDEATLFSPSHHLAKEIQCEKVTYIDIILLMEEILHHLACLRFCK